MALQLIRCWRQFPREGHCPCRRNRRVGHAVKHSASEEWSVTIVYCCIALLLSSFTVLRKVSALQSLEQTRIIACEKICGEAHGDVHMSVRPSVRCLTLIKWIKIHPERVGQSAKGAAKNGISLVIVPPEGIVFSFIFRDGSSCQKAARRRLLIRHHFQLPPWRSFAASPCSTFATDTIGAECALLYPCTPRGCPVLLSHLHTCPADCWSPMVSARC